MNWITKTFGKFFEKTKPVPDPVVPFVGNVPLVETAQNVHSSNRDRSGPRGPLLPLTRKVLKVMPPSVRKERRANYSRGDKVALRLDRNDSYRETLRNKEALREDQRISNRIQNAKERERKQENQL